MTGGSYAWDGIGHVSSMMCMSICCMSWRRVRPSNGLVGGALVSSWQEGWRWRTMAPLLSRLLYEAFTPCRSAYMAGTPDRRRSGQDALAWLPSAMASRMSVLSYRGFNTRIGFIRSTNRYMSLIHALCPCGMALPWSGSPLR